MKNFIARFTAIHTDFEAEQHSCLTWKQDGDEPDIPMLKGMIRNMTACHFFNLFVEEGEPKVNPESIIVEIHNIYPFKG
nr:hypothetical protein [uncultured Allomuricauda sp.]